MLKWLSKGVLFTAALVSAVVFPWLARASEEVATVAEAGTDVGNRWQIALATALTIIVPACAGVIMQGKTAIAALEGIGRNPAASGKFMTPMILALALIESLVIYALLIAFVLSGKIG
jgi:F-type H+-transporting ATPase subunit c